MSYDPFRDSDPADPDNVIEVGGLSDRRFDRRDMEPQFFEAIDMTPMGSDREVAVAGRAIPRARDVARREEKVVK